MYVSVWRGTWQFEISLLEGTSNVHLGYLNLRETTHWAFIERFLDVNVLCLTGVVLSNNYLVLVRLRLIMKENE